MSMTCRARRSPLLAIVLLLGLCWPAFGSQKYESSDFLESLRAALDLSRTSAASSVIVVYDIDNTLLRSTASLGSDQWFNWQTGLLSDPTALDRSRYLVAADFPSLLAIQNALYEAGPMAPPDPTEPLIVRALQALGFRTMVLTSRDPSIRDATLRELRKNGYEFRDMGPGKDLPAGFSGPNGRLVTYVDGVCMTSGQDKGKCLLALGRELNIDLRQVVFLDDAGDKVQSVYSALDSGGRDVRAIRYGHEDIVVNDFKSDRDGIWDVVTAQWVKMKSTLSH